MMPRQLTATHLGLETPGGRPLVRDLQMRIERERVAVVGRNGVGKSLLLEALAGELPPMRGHVVCVGTRHLVHQRLPSRLPGVDLHASPGEIRKRLLDVARVAAPDFLLLDEPTQDLDELSFNWLVGWLESWSGGLIVVTQ